MVTSVGELKIPGATSIKATDDTLSAELSDGRIISVPLAWHPRLVHAEPEERDNWELHAKGHHIHWPDLDEDISIESMMAGRPSGESEQSFKRWLEAKKAGRSVAYYDLVAYEKERQDRGQ